MTTADPATIVHKATRECPIIEPHPRTICALVAAREQRQHLVPAPRRDPPRE